MPLVPTGTSQVEQTLHRSRFLGFAEAARTHEEARALLKAYKARFSDATHVCHAFAVGAGNALTLGCGDDGEPAGTAGRPMLEVVKGSGIGNVFVAVVRYYGGVKLGTGGLAQAYGGTARMALQALPTEEDIPRVRARVEVDWTLLVPLRRRVVEAEGRILEERFGEGPCLEILVPQARVPGLQAWLRDASRGAATWSEGS